MLKAPALKSGGLYISVFQDRPDRGQRSAFPVSFLGTKFFSPDKAGNSRSRAFKTGPLIVGSIGYKLKGEDYTEVDLYLFIY